jgi:Uncharacterised nucleotidyltransferase
MRAGMPCLLGLLRHQQLACATESEWQDVLAIAQEENLLPWLASCLSSPQNQLPSSVSVSVLEICRQARHQAFLWSATLKHLLAAFHLRGIAVISLKGPWLAERLYGDASLRCYCDLDFLVRSCDWNAMEYTLSELGFSPLGPADDRHRRWQRAGIYIEPHFQLANPVVFDLGIEGVWSRARVSEFHGAPGWLLAPADELLFLCVHAVRHCFERLSLLLDLNLAFRQLPQEDMSNYGRRSSELKNALALCWIMATRLEDLPPLPASSAAWLASHPHLEKIAGREWQRSMLRPASSINWLAADLFYVRMNTYGRSRFPNHLRCARILLDHLTGRYVLASQDFDFAARFNLYRNWQVRMLRPVRLLLKMARLTHFTLKRYRQSSPLPDSAG